jgi:hypothetical protein
MPARVDKLQVFFPMVGEVDWKAIRKALSDQFTVTGREPSGLVVTSKFADKLEPFVVEACALAEIPAMTGLRGPLATKWKQQLTTNYERCVALRFSDLDAVLDEMNSLICAQAGLQRVTRQTMILGWNREKVAYEG